MRLKFVRSRLQSENLQTLFRIEYVSLSDLDKTFSVFGRRGEILSHHPCCHLSFISTIHPWMLSLFYQYYFEACSFMVSWTCKTLDVGLVLQIYVRDFVSLHTLRNFTLLYSSNIHMHVCLSVGVIYIYIYIHTRNSPLELLSYCCSIYDKTACSCFGE